MEAGGGRKFIKWYRRKECGVQDMGDAFPPVTPSPPFLYLTIKISSGTHYKIKI